MYDLNIVDGESLDQNPNGVVISRSIADWIHKGVGDTITIHAGGGSGDYPIVGITSFPFDGVWFVWSDLAKLAGFVTPEGDPVPTGWAVAMNQKGDISAADVEP